ncbi:hypothetical protein [Effusibacillus pohliae]|uniref:hypothetical protein n=1 Tax=Effusibacillus pohliae TaxID=232270 RepID=UPI000380E447|nr:hypothetical protein [Effusibacillus pohliae]
MEPFEWVVAGMLAYAVFPRVRQAVSNTWSSIVSTANQTMQGIGGSTATAANKTQTMYSPDQHQ